MGLRARAPPRGGAGGWRARLELRAAIRVVAQVGTPAARRSVRGCRPGLAGLGCARRTQWPSRSAASSTTTRTSATSWGRLIASCRNSPSSVSTCSPSRRCRAGRAWHSSRLFPEDPNKLVAEARAVGLSLDGPYHALLVQGDDELGALAGRS